MDQRIVSAEKLVEDETDLTLRPQKLTDYIGQNKVKEMLDIYIKAAKLRSESLDHILLYGPPGLGKTTLSQIIANELGTKLLVSSGPVLEKTSDLAAILTSLEAGDVLFIDEIHRMPLYVEEILYSAMEDFVLDILVGKDQTARSVRIDLPPFTLIGATTRFGDLSAPLRERFGVTERLDFYSLDDLEKIIKRTSKVYSTDITEEATLELAKRSRGTPRIANRLFRRLRDFAQVLADGTISMDVTLNALDKLNIDKSGLDYTDHRYLLGIIEKFNGGPVGLESLAASIGEEVTTVEDVYEPFLLQEGFVKRTARGRVATEKAYRHLNIKYYKDGLF